MNKVTSWIVKQQKSLKKIIILIDNCATPNPITELFANGLSSLKNFICLYKNTELANNLESSPWLIELNDAFSINHIQHLLNNPENNWGWLASIDSLFTLEQLANHWQQRMIVEEGSSKLIYRFQDNRTIAWHLANLSEQDIPLLLGPIDSVMAWNNGEWQSFSNPQPALYPKLINTPWLEINEPPHVKKAIRHENMRNWLFGYYKNTVTEFSNISDFNLWLEEQLDLADQWQWNERDQWEFLLGQRLDPKQRLSAEWNPLEEEAPEQHYLRCKTIFNKPLDYIETYIDTERI